MSLIRIVLLISSTVGLLALGALGFAGKPTAAIENETSDAPVLARRSTATYCARLPQSDRL